MTAETIDRFIRPQEAQQILGVGRSSLYSLVREGLLPEPIAIGARSSAWRLSTIRAAMDRIEARGRERHEARVARAVRLTAARAAKRASPATGIGRAVG